MEEDVVDWSRVEEAHGTGGVRSPVGLTSYMSDKGGDWRWSGRMGRGLQFFDLLGWRHQKEKKDMLEEMER